MPTTNRTVLDLSIYRSRIVWHESCYHIIMKWITRPNIRRNAAEYIGKQFNYLTITDSAPFNRHTMVYAKCICGNIKQYILSKILSNGVHSCGCMTKKSQQISGKNISLKHGLSRTPEYSIWAAARNRCCNPTNADYHNYGGRGITMSKEWIESFETFYKDMGIRPSPELTLERVDNEKGYCKENCVWASRLEQRLNQRCMYENNKQDDTKS